MIVVDLDSLEEDWVFEDNFLDDGFFVGFSFLFGSALQDTIKTIRFIEENILIFY